MALVAALPELPLNVTMTLRFLAGASVAAGLALGFEPLEAAEGAKRIAAEAVRDGLHDVGEGAGPVDAIGLAERRAGRTAVP